MEQFKDYIYIGIGAAVGLLALLLILRQLLRRKPKAAESDEDLRLDITTLGETGPAAGSAQIEFYNVPVRLAAVVMAPAGRGGSLPAVNRWPEMLDALAPGMSTVIETHQPTMRRWPAQLSTSGFAQSFFRNAALPGDGGKGTPWCSAAGKCETDNEPVLVALIFRSQRPNSLGQFVIQRATKWLDVLRVKLS